MITPGHGEAVASKPKRPEGDPPLGAGDMSHVIRDHGHSTGDRGQDVSGTPEQSSSVFINPARMEMGHGLNRIRLVTNHLPAKIHALTAHIHQSTTGLSGMVPGVMIQRRTRQREVGTDETQNVVPTPEFGNRWSAEHPPVSGEDRRRICPQSSRSPGSPSAIFVSSSRVAGAN